MGVRCHRGFSKPEHGTNPWRTRRCNRRGPWKWQLPTTAGRSAGRFPEANDPRARRPAEAAIMRNLTVKGFGGRYPSAETLFSLTRQEQKGMAMKKKTRKVIAYRKTCKAKGTGLSHYILMDRKSK